MKYLGIFIGVGGDGVCAVGLLVRAVRNGGGLKKNWAGKGGRFTDREVFR